MGAVKIEGVSSKAFVQE